MYYLGIDAGTSALKALLIDEKGGIICQASREYAVEYPRSGWSEQHPYIWWNAAEECVKEICARVDSEKIAALSFGGQMHGLVILDNDGDVIRPCILWNDGRTEKQTEYLNSYIGKEELSHLTGNIAFAGFTAPKLLWLKENEPDNFNKIAKIMLPKDYLAYRFSGAFCTDVSDAGGTLLFDVKNRKWSEKMCSVCGVSLSQLPTVYESWQTVGKIKPDVAEKLGLSKNVIIAAGASDNAAAAVGTGTVRSGNCNISLGTSGTVFVATDNYGFDKNCAVHSFCHANGKWHLLGCVLSAASCNKWWTELNNRSYGAFDKQIENNLAECGVYFLPYLMGERSPHNDVTARGCFIGLTPETTEENMEQAVLEGVAFALKDCVEAAVQTGAVINGASLCGGGAKSRVWVRIIANVLNMPVRLLKTQQGPSFGAAVLAAVGSGAFESVEAACDKLVSDSESETVYPDKEIALLYARRYEEYKMLYPALKPFFNTVFAK